MLTLFLRDAALLINSQLLHFKKHLDEIIVLIPFNLYAETNALEEYHQIKYIVG